MCETTATATATSTRVATALPGLSEGQGFLVQCRGLAAPAARWWLESSKSLLLMGREEPAPGGWVEEGPDLLAIESLLVESKGVSVLVMG